MILSRAENLSFEKKKSTQVGGLHMFDKDGYILQKNLMLMHFTQTMSHTFCVERGQVSH